MENVIHIPIVESSQVGNARRHAQELARNIGLSEVDTGRVGIVVTELGTNLVKHAANGELFLQTVEYEGKHGIEALSIDSGPGMADIETCLRDGYSTVGTPGTGMGAVRRQSSLFDIWSAAETGSVVVARIFPREPGRAVGIPALADAVELGAIQRPMSGETACGDGWAARRAESGWRIIVADGLGHGPMAAAASEEAIGIFLTSQVRGLTAMVDEIHRGTRHTRGVALALVELDLVRREVRFVGVGNIAGIVVGYDSGHSMVSHNGTVGQQYRKVQEFIYPWPDQSLVILSSDGIKTRWSLDAYPGLARRDPALIAGVLYRDFARGQDDRTVIVIRARQQ